MSALPSITQSEFSADSLPANSWVKRSLLALVRFLITLCIGVAATVAWQSYGDAARAMIANSFPQLGWLARQAELVAQSAPDAITLAAPAIPSPDQQQSNVTSPDLDAVRQSIDRIATSMSAIQEQMSRGADRIANSIVANQEQIARSVDQLTVGQEQMTREITKLQAVEQYVLYKNADPPPRPAAAPVPKPVLRASQAPTVPTPAKAP